ncbi:MAG: branched-chain amino acid ABC transporter permease [Armatimonadota bacterium]|nr:branched-chain amino acid ABC transporter permease [Armatimonadota bacterium]
MNDLARRWAVAGLLLALVLLPAVASRYVTYLVIHILLLALNAVGFNLLFGQTGLLSFGQAGFYAVGAYTCARILLAWPSLLPGVLGGTAAAALAALLLGSLSVRHTRIYFAMLTLAFGMMIFSLAWKWRAVTGGDDGLVGIPRAPLELFGLVVALPTVERYYYVVLVAAVLAVALMHRVVHSPLGLALRAVRDSEVRAEHVGLNVRRLRLVAFTVAGAYAGLAGSLLPPLENTVTPPIAHWTASAEPVLATLLGGIRHFAGPLVGAFVLVVAKDVIVRFTVHWSLVLGAVVVALVLGFRGGLAGALEALTVRGARVRPVSAAAGEEGR